MTVKVFISLVVVASLAIALSRTMKISRRYERHALSPWKAMDSGIDPTVDNE